MLSFLTENYSMILAKCAEHLMISFLSLGMGILVAVPLGIAITKNKNVAALIIGVASVFQTIPTFALLSLMTIIGVGKVPAILALFIYSLLPILRNTCLGIDGVSSDYLDAAKGMGMTPQQILYKVKIPMAMSVIMAGIRLSAVYVLAWATLASYIGAGGLGDLIFNGLQNYLPPMIIWGTIPVSIMAIFTDYFLGKLEKNLTPFRKEGGRR